MFEKCCHCEDRPAERHNITYDPPPDPNIPAGSVVQQSQAGPAGQVVQSSQPAQDPPKPQKAEEQAPLSERSASSLTPEEKAAEKQRLQELVKTFAKNAVQGVTCQLLDEASGSLKGAKYVIDKQLKKMTFTIEGAVQHVVPLVAIKEIYRIEDGEGLFAGAIKSMNHSDNERVLMLVYSDDKGKEQQFCFFEMNTLEKERFLTCMKILRLYSRPARRSRLEG